MKVALLRFCRQIVLMAIIVVVLSGPGMADPSNTQLGTNALHSNTTGIENTAIGADSLYSNNSGVFNAATGFESLYSNTGGYSNAGFGSFTLFANTIGVGNTATGTAANKNNTTGNFNTSSGADALYDNTVGNNNTAFGFHTLLLNTTGTNNTALGFEALGNATKASGNVGLGHNAGFNLTTGSNNVDIANLGTATDSNTIRIGTQGTQTKAFIAGINNSLVMGNPVVISNTGQLGVVMSSARFKRDISNMGAASDGLLKLRPVTFRYKNDPAAVRRYGLVAEEVARVYPELVARSPDGKVETVNYLTLTSMLLNELQKRTVENRRQAAQLAIQAHDLASLEQRLSSLERTIASGRSSELAAALGR